MCVCVYAARCRGRAPHTCGVYIYMYACACVYVCMYVCVCVSIYTLLVAEGVRHTPAVFIQIIYSTTHLQFFFFEQFIVERHTDISLSLTHTHTHTHTHRNKLVLRACCLALYSTLCVYVYMYLPAGRRSCVRHTLTKPLLQIKHLTHH